MAIFFSIPIYLYLFLTDDLILEIFSSFFAFFAFYFFFHIKHSFFQSGFWIGIFWFWWIGLSFRYYNLTWMIPFVIFFIGIGYGIIFWIINKIFNLFQFSIFNFPFSIYLWLLFLTFGFDYIRPFTFDWLKPEVILINTFFGITKIAFLFFLIGILLLKNKKVLSSIFFIISVFLKFYQTPNIKMPNLNIYITSTNIPENKKWQKNFIPIEIKNNFKLIKKAIKEKKDVIILPESAFPLFLNLYPSLMEKLINLSKKITIITGALHYKNKNFFNSTYIFENEKVTILDKHILVPFGEYIPFPFFQKEINKIFFKGASDYKTSKKFGIFKIKNYKFINAICYEATLENLYKLKPKYIVALTNDAWFKPSIEPVLQKMLIKLYAYKYKKIVFHSINGYKSYIIKWRM